jgi:hypothetical protein
LNVVEVVGGSFVNLMKLSWSVQWTLLHCWWRWCSSMAYLRWRVIYLFLESAPCTAELRRSHISKYYCHIVVVIDVVQSRPDYQWFLICCS